MEAINSSLMASIPIVCLCNWQFNSVSICIDRLKSYCRCVFKSTNVNYNTPNLLVKNFTERVLLSHHEHDESTQDMAHLTAATSQIHKTCTSVLAVFLIIIFAKPNHIATFSHSFYSQTKAL